MLPFWASDLVLLAVQAAMVLVPARAVPGLDHLKRSRAWAWVLPASLGLTIALLAILPGAAPAYTYLALVGCPVGAALVFSGGRRRRAGLALLAPALLAVAWAREDTLVGQAAALALTALSTIPLAAILSRVAPALALKAGIVAMAVLDAILVFSNGLQQSNDVLNAAAPAAHLPRLQLADFGAAIMGYGDLFIAAVLGAVLATRARRRRGAALTLGLALAFDALFFVIDVLPATVPVALALLADEAWERRASLAAALRMQRPAPERAAG